MGGSRGKVRDRQPNGLVASGQLVCVTFSLRPDQVTFLDKLSVAISAANRLRVIARSDALRRFLDAFADDGLLEAGALDHVQRNPALPDHDQPLKEATNGAS